MKMQSTKTSKAARVRVNTLTLVEAALIGGRLVPLAGVVRSSLRSAPTPGRGADLNPIGGGGGVSRVPIRAPGLAAVPVLYHPPPPIPDTIAHTRPGVKPPSRRASGHKILDHFLPFRLRPRAIARVAASANPPVEDQMIDWSAVRRRFPLWGKISAGGHRQLKMVWAALRAALAATGRTAISLKTNSGREAALKWCRLAYWLIKTTALSGITHTLLTLKAWTSEVRRWVVEGVREQDRQGGLAKYLCGSLRYHITNDDAAAQLSYAGRALPRGTLSVQRKALIKHKEALLRIHRTPRHVLASAREFAAGWGERFLGAVPLMNCGFSQSSCLEVSTSKGGTLEATIERANALQTERSLSEAVAGLERSLKLSSPELPDCDRGILARNTVLRDQALKELRADILRDGYPRASVAVLPERGVKARVVTKSPWALVQLAHPVRAWLLEGLRKDPRIAEVLDGKHMEAAGGLVDVPRLADGREFLSADLTSASDLIPGDLLAAIVNGLLDGTGDTLPEWAEEVLRLATGPMLIDYTSAWGPSPDKRALVGLQKILSEGGALMGLPTTWALLCLVQLFWAEQAWRRVFPDVHSRLSPGDPAVTPATKICGDDLAAWWPKQVSDAYEQVVVSCGGVFSVGKHFRSRGVVVFTELLLRAEKATVRSLARSKDSDLRKTPTIASWEREGRPFMMKRRRPHAKPTKSRRSTRRGRQPTILMKTRGIRDHHDLSDHRRVVTRLVPFRSIPLKGLLEPEGGGPTAANHVRQPRWVNIGPVASGISKMTGNPNAVRRVLRCLYPNYWDWFSRHGFVPALPRFLGGPGLPPKTGDVDRLALPADLLLRVRHLVHGTPWHLLRSPTSPWSMAGAGEVRKMMAQHAEARLQTHARPARVGRVPFEGKGVLLGGVDVLEDLSTRFENEAIVGIYGCRDLSRRSVFKVRPGEVSRAVAKFWGKVTVPKGERYRKRDGERRRGRLLNKTSIRNLESRWKEVQALQRWHADPIAAQEGFVLRLSRRVKLDLAIKLGQTGRLAGTECDGTSPPHERGGEEPGRSSDSAAA